MPTILIDAMNTIFVLKEGKYQLYSRLLSERGLIASTEDIKLVYNINIDRIDKLALFSNPESSDYKTIWTKINAEIISQLFPHLSGCETQFLGRVIYEELMGNPDNYVVPEEMREFLKNISDMSISRKIKVIISSNQEEKYIKRLISAFKLTSFIDKVFTSETIKRRKPDKAFYDFIIKELQTEKKEVIVIGNDLRSDILGAINAGIKHTYLLNWKNRKLRDQEEEEEVGNAKDNLKNELLGAINAGIDHDYLLRWYNRKQGNKSKKVIVRRVRNFERGKNKLDVVRVNRALDHNLVIVSNPVKIFKDTQFCSIVNIPATSYDQQKEKTTSIIQQQPVISSRRPRRGLRRLKKVSR